MCWQCTTPPDKYLNIFPSFQPLGWYDGQVDGVLEFSLEGEIWHTNPEMEPGSIGESLPGDLDCNGVAVFVKGKYSHAQNKATHPAR